MSKTYQPLPLAQLRARLADGTQAERVRELRSAADRLGEAAQYGWGHTIDFGPFKKEGLLKTSYLGIAGGFDSLAWWPSNFEGMRVADVGCFTGGISLLMAERGAQIVFAVDEIPEHVEQCAFVADVLDLPSIRPVCRSLYALPEVIEQGSLDYIVCAGVLYHLSDMLVGLHVLRQLLKPEGVLLIESNGVDDDARSYANFGRFFGGMWWQPTALCIRDMCAFMGYKACDVHFYEQNRCIARAVRGEGELVYRRGLNATFSSLRDGMTRSLDPTLMAPAHFE